MTAFYDYKQQIGVVLAMHTTPAPEAANIDGRVNDVMKIREVADKIFRKLDTPPERKVLAFIQDHGDVKECITDEATLDVLVSLTGKSLASFDPTRMGNPERGSESLKTELIKELEEDIDKALEKHMPLFTAKLHLNQEQLTTRISAAEENIIQTLSGGEYKKVRDEVRGNILRSVRSFSYPRLGFAFPLAFAELEG